MNVLLKRFSPWLPALLMMIVIFLFSSQSSNKLPNYGAWDYFVKKSSHAVGYGLLAMAYLHAMPEKNYFLALILAVLYSVTDEFHQSFVPGRTPSLVDVLVFDNLGAIVSLFIYYKRTKAKFKA